ncbi:MAG TPA: AAA family ATPase, partial [Paludibacter sp.]|nr:AAA family ATPase [Paludibacter sp.]
WGILTRPQVGDFQVAIRVEMDLPPQRHLVNGILAVGCNLLAGKPKTCKSWLALQIAISVALGRPLFGCIKVERKGVLYLALEDNKRRLRERLSLALPESEVPENLFFEIEYERASSGGLTRIKNFLKSTPGIGLVIVDTLARFRDIPKSNKNTYYEDTEAIVGLKKIAEEFQVAILIIHHLRKYDGTEDPFDNISGTTGLTGATDANMVLELDKRSRIATLHIEGKDVEKQEIEMKFDDETVSWGLCSPLEKLSPERKQIIEVLRKAREGNKTMSPKEIAGALGQREKRLGSYL